MRSKHIMILSTLLCVMILPAMAQSESAVINIGDGSGIVTIPITVTNAENVGSIDLTVNYDPDIANVTNVANGDMSTIITNLENTADGWIRIVAYQVGDGLSGTFIMANVNFVPVGSSGSCPLEISVTTFKDATPTGNVMPYNVSNGMYTISYEALDSMRGGGGGDGTYPPDPTPTVSPTTPVNVTPITTPTTSPTPSPTKTLPDEDDYDDEDLISLGKIVMAIVALLIAAGVIIMKMKSRKE